MRTIESMRFNEDERRQVAVDLHNIANKAWLADQLGSDAPTQVEVDVRTAAFLNANRDQLGDDVSLLIDTVLAVEETAYEASHHVKVTPVSLHIGRSGVVKFMRTQAELVEGKDFTEQDRALKEAQMWLEYRTQQRDSQAEIARVALKELEGAREELHERNQTEYARKVIEQQEIAARLRQKFPGININPMRDDKFAEDRFEAFLNTLKAPDPKKAARNSNYIYSPYGRYDKSNIKLLKIEEFNRNNY
jgi:hypothetical protein